MSEHVEGEDYDIVRCAKQRTAKAMTKLAKVMNDGEQPGSTRLWAASVLLARGWGPSTQFSRKPEKDSCEEAARAWGPDILLTLDAIMEDETQPACIGVWAAQMVLDCAYGPSAKLRLNGMRAPRIPMPRPSNPYKGSLMGSSSIGKVPTPPGTPPGFKW